MIFHIKRYKTKTYTSVIVDEQKIVFSLSSYTQRTVRCSNCNESKENLHTMSAKKLERKNTDLTIFLLFFSLLLLKRLRMNSYLVIIVRLESTKKVISFAYTVLYCVCLKNRTVRENNSSKNGLNSRRN